MAFGVGAVYATAGTIAHAYRVGGFPLGLLLAVIGSAALLIAVRALSGDRWAALCTGIGMMLAVIVFSGEGPGGSVVVPGGSLDRIGPVSLGVVWMIAVPLMTLSVVLYGRRRRPGTRLDA